MEYPPCTAKHRSINYFHPYRFTSKRNYVDQEQNLLS